MLKNSVFNSKINVIKWIKCAGIRAIKTMAQTALGMLIIGTPAAEVDWFNVLSISAVAGVISILTSVAGIPEVKEESQINKCEQIKEYS